MEFSFPGDLTDFRGFVLVILVIRGGLLPEYREQSTTDGERLTMNVES